jgi:hypothetical protein
MLSEKLTFSLHGLEKGNSWVNHLNEGQIFRNKLTGFPKLILTRNDEFHAWLLKNLQGKFPRYDCIDKIPIYHSTDIRCDSFAKEVQVFKIRDEFVYLLRGTNGRNELWAVYLKPGYYIASNSNLKGLHYNREDCILQALYKLGTNFSGLQQKRDDCYKSRLGWNPETKQINSKFYLNLARKSDDYFKMKK